MPTQIQQSVIPVVIQSEKSTLDIYSLSPGILCLLLRSKQNGVTALTLDVKSGRVSIVSKGLKDAFLSQNLTLLASSTIMASCTIIEICKIIRATRPEIFRNYARGFLGGRDVPTLNICEKSPDTAPSTSQNPLSMNDI